MKIIHAILLTMVLLFVAACAKPQPVEPVAPVQPEQPIVEPVQPPVVQPVTPSGADVQVLGRGGFEPIDVKIAVGGTVTFKVMDKSNHKISQIGSDITSPLLKPGDTYERTFSEAGTYEVLDVVFGKKLKVTVE